MSYTRRIKRAVKRNERALGVLFSLLSLFLRNRIRSKGKNNILIKSGALLNKCRVEFRGDNNYVSIARGARLRSVHIKMDGDNHRLIIGENSILSSTNFWFEDDHCTIAIGGNTTTEGAHFGAVEPNSVIEVGEDCMFAHGIELITTDSHSILDTKTGKRINEAENIRIGDHVWVGAYAKVLKGVHIGDHTIVGVGSIVSKPFGNNLIVAGVPAKVVKEHVSWVRERI
jgi:acetyltransferase-like isoleucine patch superfamily enzyme